MRGRGSALRLPVLPALLAMSAAGCGLGGPPAPPTSIQPPPLELEAIDLTEGRDELLPPPPPPSEEIRLDPILGSSLIEEAEFRRQVNYWILRWQTWEEGAFTRYLGRMAAYTDLVDQEVEERGLPYSLRYLPLIESGYNPGATSRVGAAGMWQFMSATARFLGMDVTPLIDERRDPWRSTEMALEYLIELNDRFEGSWYLALAAYNGGWGRVQRIIDRHGGGAAPSDSLFWALREHFPAETRNYVPKLLAAAWVAENPLRYGFEAMPGEQAVVEQVVVPDATSLDVVARAAGVRMEDVERLNPHLLRGYTPPDRETALRIPSGSAARFNEVFPTIPSAERVSFVEHRVQRGETLSHVGDRYRVPLSELRAANPGLNPRRIQIGQWVVVPRSPTSVLAGSDQVRRAGSPVSAPAERTGAARTAAAAISGPSAPSVVVAEAGEGGAEEEIVHRVGRGESLWIIARRYGVSLSDLRSWNDLGPDPVLYPGDAVRIRGVTAAVYRVQRGDTLSGIALRHGIRMEALLQANGLGRTSVIRPGDEVRIPGRSGE